MARERLDQATVDRWIATHTGWEHVHEDSLTKLLKFPDFAAALGFVVRIGLLAEKRDHHPDVELGWGKARITWSTHDAGGVTSLDLEMAEATERAYTAG